MKIAFHTLGCKVNQYETQALKEKFLKKGYEIVEDNKFADIYVINTCTVTNLSDRKSRQFIRKVKKINPDSITAVIGCYAQVSPEEVEKIEGVNIIAGTSEKSILDEYIEEYLNKNNIKKIIEPENKDIHIKDILDVYEYEETGIITSMDSRTRAFIKIQEGCNQYCSYCIIPYARGNVRSRKIEDIVKEAESLIDKGFKELVLTGINTALYGTEDLNSEKAEPFRYKDSYGIVAVVWAINDIPGEFRIRLGSLEPNVVRADYAKQLLEFDKLCHHMHLSLQSGSDKILKEMNRSYTRNEYLELCETLKSCDKNYGITTDIIVGFPGETDEDFNDSCKIVQEVGICKTHVFKYSKREGTKAAIMKNQISGEVKSLRSEKLIKLSEEASKKFYQKNIGQTRTVLFEKFDEETGLLEGFTDNYIKVYCDGNKKHCNTFKEVQLIELYEEGVKGNI